MPELIVELFSEEIPARMQRNAAETFAKLVGDGLRAAGFESDFETSAYATPRRLALHVQGIPARQPDRLEERKGPRVGSPTALSKDFSRAPGSKASISANSARSERQLSGLPFAGSRAAMQHPFCPR